MSPFRVSSPLCRLAASLALVGWVGFGASACLCAHGAPGPAPVASVVPSCHAAEPAPGDTLLSSTCCQVGQPVQPAVTLDWRGPKNDPPSFFGAGAKGPVLAAHWLRPSLPLAASAGAAAAPLEASPPHAPPPELALPLRI